MAQSAVIRGAIMGGAGQRGRVGEGTVPHGLCGMSTQQYGDTVCTTGPVHAQVAGYTLYAMCVCIYAPPACPPSPPYPPVPPPSDGFLQLPMAALEFWHGSRNL